MNPKVSIIILNWNGRQNTKECLNSLAKLTYPNYEIILVDNGSTDGSQKMIENEFQDVVILIKNKENVGFTGGCNEGIKYTSGEYVAFINNDINVDPKWLDNLIKPFLIKGGNIGATTSKIMNYWNPDIVEYGGNSQLNIFGQVRASSKIEYVIDEVQVVAGASFMIKKSVIDDLDELFCPLFFAYYEEFDLSWRLINQGYKLIYAPDSIVYHKSGESTKRNKELSNIMYRYNIRNKYLTYYRNLSPLKFLLIGFPVLLISDIILAFIQTIFLRKTSNMKVIMSGIGEFFKVRKKVRRYGNSSMSSLYKRIYHLFRRILIKRHRDSRKSTL